MSRGVRGRAQEQRAKGAGGGTSRPVDHARLEADEAQEPHTRAAGSPQLVYLAFYQLKLVLHLVYRHRQAGTNEETERERWARQCCRVRGPQDLRRRG